MADRYKWDYQDAVVLRDHTLEVHDGLNDTLDKLDALINDMKSDPDWGGEHRDALMAWMDLLRQFHAQLADPAVGLAAVQVLNQFISNWDGYYGSSATYASLARV